MFSWVRDWWDRRQASNEVEVRRRLEEVRQHNPVPVFWLFGKTQSGKTSVVKFLTGADDAEVGHGFQPCTRFTRQYLFPKAEAPLLSFMDTRGVDEPGYDPSEDIAHGGSAAHVVIVTVKALDHAQENVVRHLQTIRAARPGRPILLLLTCLHEAYPQQQHLAPFPFRFTKAQEMMPAVPPASQLVDLGRSLEAQRLRFSSLVDHWLPVDLTRPEEGFHIPHYGGEVLQEALVSLLPEAHRQTLQVLETGVMNLRQLHAERGLPTILGYSMMAATAGAIPVPFVSPMLIPGIQRRMIMALAEDYGRPEHAEPFLTEATRLGLGRPSHQTGREFLKVVPSVGAIAGAAKFAAATFALGKAFCYFDSGIVHGELPDAQKLGRYYEEQVEQAKYLWKPSVPAAAATVPQSEVSK